MQTISRQTDIDRVCKPAVLPRHPKDTNTRIWNIYVFFHILTVLFQTTHVDKKAMEKKKHSNSLSAHTCQLRSMDFSTEEKKTTHKILGQPIIMHMPLFGP